MTDLTEQWKKGQLKGFKWYYVKFKTGEIDICWLTEWSNDELGTGGQYFDGIKEENILQVIAPVPSYEEWQALNGNMDSVMQTNQALCKKLAKLKDLLTQSRIYVKIETEDYDDRTVSKADKEEAKKLLKQIGEVLR